MSKTSTEVVPAKSALPALADTPSVAPLDSSDVALPKLYKGEYQSSLVQDESNDLTPGCIFTASGQDDPEPEILVEKATAKDCQGVLAHVLSATKGKSMQDEDGELQTWAFNDPNAHPDARTTYQYVLALPEDQPGIPVKLTLAKTSTGCAKRINFHLMKHAGAPHELAFRLTLKPAASEKNGQKFRWFVWQEKLVESDAKNVQAAEELAILVNSIKPNDIERTAPTAEPAI
jgi:hypothetical protein